MVNAILELETFKTTMGSSPVSAMIEAVNVDKSVHLYLWNVRSKQLWDDSTSRVVSHGVALNMAIETLHKMGVEIQSVYFE